MIVSAFLIIKKVNQIRFFKRIFLMADINLEIVFFRIFFFILSNIDVNFLDQKL